VAEPAEQERDCPTTRLYVETVRCQLKSGLRLTRIRKLLRREKIFVSYATLHRFAVQELGFSSHAPTLPVIDGEPGQELQFDSGWLGSLGRDLLGRFGSALSSSAPSVRATASFIPSSRRPPNKRPKPVKSPGRFSRGSSAVLIVDNAKAMVDKADPLCAKLNRTFREYSQARGFFVDTTRVRAPRDKARVERSVSTVRDDCFAGERLYDLEQARAHARTWCPRTTACAGIAPPRDCP
jgi:transposase